MFWFLLACSGDGGKDSANPSQPEPGTTMETGDIKPDEQGMLDSQPGWQSTEIAYATGGAFADMDRDGDLDLVVSEGNDMEPGFLRIYFNHQGELEQEASWSSTNAFYYGHLCIGDVDGDGWSDVIVSRYIGNQGFSEPGGLQLFHNQQGELSLLWEVDGFYSFSSALGDMDNDGDLDLAVAVGEAYYNEPDNSRVYENDGQGNFELAWMTEESSHSYDVGWADLDDNGFLDLLLANHEEPHRIYLNQQGSLPDSASHELEGDGFEGNTLDWGDVNGDGILDVVVSDNNQSGGAGVLRVWCGPDWSLCWESEDTPMMQSAVSFRDVDMDDDLDLVAGAWWGAVRIYFNEEGALESKPSWVSEPDDIVVEAFAWADLDGVYDEIFEYTGSGLILLPDGAWVLSIECGVAGDGYISGSDCLRAEVVLSKGADLLVTDWDPQQGNWLFPFVTEP